MEARLALEACLLANLCMPTPKGRFIRCEFSKEDASWQRSKDAHGAQFCEMPQG